MNVYQSITGEILLQARAAEPFYRELFALYTQGVDPKDARCQRLRQLILNALEIPPARATSMAAYIRIQRVEEYVFAALPHTTDPSSNHFVLPEVFVRH